jgi:hypothetical protein
MKAPALHKEKPFVNYKAGIAFRGDLRIRIPLKAVCFFLYPATFMPDTAPVHCNRSKDKGSHHFFL